MIPSAQLSNTFKSNHMLVTRHLEGLEHSEALLTPSFQANSINWILGHLLNGRVEALRHLGRLFLWSDSDQDRYRTGSDPIDSESALPLGDLVQRFNETQAALEAALEEAGPEFLEQIVQTGFGDRPRWQQISGLGWHETYHVGQMELLRQLVLDTREAEG